MKNHNQHNPFTPKIIFGTIIGAVESQHSVVIRFKNNGEEVEKLTPNQAPFVEVNLENGRPRFAKTGNKALFKTGDKIAALARPDKGNLLEILYWNYQSAWNQVKNKVKAVFQVTRRGKGRHRIIVAIGSAMDLLKVKDQLVGEGLQWEIMDSQGFRPAEEHEIPHLEDFEERKPSGSASPTIGDANGSLLDRVEVKPEIVKFRLRVRLDEGEEGGEVRYSTPITMGALETLQRKNDAGEIAWPEDLSRCYWDKQVGGKGPFEPCVSGEEPAITPNREVKQKEAAPVPTKAKATKELIYRLHGTNGQGNPTNVYFQGTLTELQEKNAAGKLRWPRPEQRDRTCWMKGAFGRKFDICDAPEGIVPPTPIPDAADTSSDTPATEVADEDETAVDGTASAATPEEPAELASVS